MNGEKLWPVPIGTQKDVDEAVEAAQKAFESWREVPIEERKEYLNKTKDALLAHSNEMTELLCAETGKPKAVAEMETVGGVAGWFGHHATLSIPEERDEDDEKVILTRYTPLGVVGAICPWNL